MTSKLTDVLKSVERLPETDQDELADQIEELIYEHKIAAGEASYARDGGIPVDEAFDHVKRNLQQRYGS